MVTVEEEGDHQNRHEARGQKVIVCWSGAKGGSGTRLAGEDYLGNDEGSEEGRGKESQVFQKIRMLSGLFTQFIVMQQLFKRG